MHTATKSEEYPYLGHLCHLDLSLAARSDGNAVELGRASALSDGHLVLVHDGVAALVQRVGVGHLGHVAGDDRLLAPGGQLLGCTLQVRRQPGGSAVGRNYAGVGSAVDVQRTLGTFGPVLRRDLWTVGDEAL
jgi:hypothetical protein